MYLQLPTLRQRWDRNPGPYDPVTAWAGRRATLRAMVAHKGSRARYPGGSGTGSGAGPMSQGWALRPGQLGPIDCDSRGRTLEPRLTNLGPRPVELAAPTPPHTDRPARLVG